jgi:hypothetical protein
LTWAVETVATGTLTDNTSCWIGAVELEPSLLIELWDVKGSERDIFELFPLLLFEASSIA